jgi:hypothetical protein
MESNSHQYSIKFRCPNCGEIFERLIQKGVIAQGHGGACPCCGVIDGQAQVGHFIVIKDNSEYDEPIRPYNTPRM